MSKESFTGIENYLHDLHYDKSKKSVLHSITKNLNSVLQQINLNSPLDVRLGDSDYFSAGGEEECGSTDDSCSFDVSALSETSSERAKKSESTNLQPQAQEKGSSRTSKEDEKSSSSAASQGLRPTKSSGSYGQPGFKFEVDSGASLTSTLLGSACSSKPRNKGNEDCSSTAKSRASSTESSINISASLEERQVDSSGSGDVESSLREDSGESSMSSHRASLETSFHQRQEAEKTDHRIHVLENKLERQSRLLKAALGRQVELKQEAESFYLSKKQLQKQMEDTSRKYNMLKQEVAKTREENIALASELKKSKNIGREILDARRSARAALSEMATQNAKLTAMLVERKQEIRELTTQLDAFKKKEVRGTTQQEDRFKAYENEIEELRERLHSEQRRSRDLERNAAAMQQQARSDSERSEVSTQSDFGRFSSDQEASSGGLSTSSESVSMEETPRTRKFRVMEKENSQLKQENSKLKVAAEQLQKHEERQRQRGKVEQYKQAGNNAYNAGNYKDAQAHYSTALSHKVEDIPMKAVLYCNRSAASIKLGKLIDAIADCTKAISLDKTYNRAYQRRSEAYEKIGDYKNSSKDLEKYIRSMGGYERVPSDLRRHYAMMQRRATRDTALNPYHVLGVSMSCSSSEIKSTYRKLALKYHPDKTSADLEKSVSEGLFKIVSEAYTVLSDPDKKAKYDFHSQRRASTFF
ncbi:DnaJ domain-containing protein [Chloropicon primus]|uniref:DnaJ domain-containing protein n=1 Tax=Chloropicon primus TaxID=1764295 RepID=A0A5B8MBB7_9CHLO|nr:DnaJ domain-containing protein [Chloropicon primus]UPQ96883.1 DnaJ domain-containing protein [Chloropicon primus]|eukprot:QDZ17667.1 DnaJ domain-containing protein [Chloropicon primus]